MVGAMREAGFEVQVSQAPITPALLQGAAGIILAGPMRPLTAEEFQALDVYVREGGTVLLTVHVPFPVIAVPSHFGLPVTPVVIESDAPLPGADPSVFVADGVRSDPVTQGVRQLLVVSGWQVSAGSKQGEHRDRQRSRGRGATRTGTARRMSRGRSGWWALRDTARGP